MSKASVSEAVYERASRLDWRPSEIRTRTERVRPQHARPAAEITTEALLERFMRHQKTRLRPTTFERLGGTLRTLQMHLPKQANAITRRTVADYIETRSRTVKPGTVAKEISSLKRCLRLAVDWGLLHENAASRAKLPALPAGRTRYLSPGELRAALETAPAWLRAPMAFAVCTGIRRGEMLSLTWKDVDLGGRRVYLRETSNDSPRVLPLSDDALYVLQSMPMGAASDPVFADVDPLRLSVTTRRVFQRLGIMDASFHTLRHTSASWMVQHGVDLHSVGRLLGLKTPQMTLRYAHLSPGYTNGAAQRLNAMTVRSLDRQIARIPRRFRSPEAIGLAGSSLSL